MAKAPSFPTYKWWETDDKTKRLYTELLAEKLSSPRKTSSSSLSRKPSNGKDIGARFTSSPKHNRDSDAHSSKVTESSRAAEVKNKEEEEDEEKKFGKYTFETITIDTLAKYDYIKSPKKRAAPTVPISFFEQTCKPVITTGDNKEDLEKARGKTAKCQFLMHQKVSSAKKEFQQSKSNGGEKESSVKRDKAERATKLEEIPEYSTSSESNESSTDETVVRVKTIPKNEENKSQTSLTKSKEEQNTKQANKDNQPLKIEELSNKFQLLSEEVAQLEFKMFEFSDDIQKLKQNMGFKSVDPKVKNEEASHDVEKKNEYAMNHQQKSLTFAEKFNNKAMLMKQQASPSKMLAAKPGKFFAGKLPQKDTTKEEAIAELRKNKTLNEIVSKIKEQELSEDEIQEILRCAKEKYVDRPNYLEEMGFGRENNN